MSANVCTWFYTLLRTNFLKISSQIPINLLAREKKDYIKNRKVVFCEFRVIGQVWSNYTYKPTFCQACVRWSFEGHIVTLSKESLNRFKLSHQIITVGYRSLDKLANRLCLSKHPTDVCLLYTGNIKATPLRSLCNATLCPWNICQFEPLCSS